MFFANLFIVIKKFAFAFRNTSENKLHSVQVNCHKICFFK